MFQALLIAGVLMAADPARSIGRAAVPTTLKDFDADRSGGVPAYPDYVVRLYNLQRVLDGDLKVEQRIESLRVVNRLGPAGQASEPLARLLSDPKTPDALRQQAVECLLRADYPGLDAHVMAMLPRLGPDSQTRQTLLDWLARHPSDEALSQIVQLWAQSPPTGPDEAKFRAIVQQITGRPWDQGLVESLNAPNFYARGSASEVLATRRSAGEVGRLLQKVLPRTDAVAAMRTFLNQFGTVPAGTGELVQAVSIWRNEQSAMPAAAQLSRNWGTQAGYRFEVRDFPLLAALAGDPVRQRLPRRQLILELGKELLPRRHVHAALASKTAAGTDDFHLQADSLTLADLWNLYLADEMLRQVRVRQAVGIMAEKDRADRSGAWGGLVFYSHGKCEARLYGPDANSHSPDGEYHPSRQMVVDSRMALLRLRGHFTHEQNADRAGPDAAELAEAAEVNCYGLILTSLGEEGFCAHYYTPKGAVVSLGTFLYGG